MQRKLRIIKYPKQNEEEIVNICVQKCRKEFSNKDRKINKKKEIYDFSNCPNFNEDNSKKLGTFMVKYNEKVEIYKLPLLQWSFRDIDKIIKRIFEHINDTNNYINFKFYHFIYFYLFSSISKENLEKMINFCEQKQNKKDSLKNIVHKLFIEIFELDSNISEELKSSFFGKPKIDINKQLIIKENLQIKFDFDDELKNSCNSFNLSNYYNDLFKLKLFSNYEPVLLIGPSSYKTHLAEYYIKHIKKANYNKIYLNQKTTIEDLLGGPYFLSQNLSKYYYFYLLWKIIDIPYEKEHKKKLILNFFGNIINQNHKIKILCKIYNNIYNNFQKSLQRKNNKPQIVFKEGEILLSILKKESIIFKDIHKVPTEVFERFNEFLSSERILSLNEDIYGTFFSDNDDNKIIDVKQMDNIEIIATCPENSFQALSESVLSRFSIIFVGEHEIEEKEEIIKNYSKKVGEINDKYLNEILDLFKKKQLTDIKKIKNFIDIFHEMNVCNKQDNKNFDYIKYYIQLEKDDSKINSLLLDNNSPIYLKEGSLYSKISNLSVNINNSYNNSNCDKNIVFTPVFNEMIDLIHFGFCTGTSLIFEGFPGQGKQKAVNYYCNLLNCEIENIVITSNFSAKDLFKKSIVQTNSSGIVEIVEVETKLYQILFNSSNDKKETFDDKNKKKKNFICIS